MEAGEFEAELDPYAAARLLVILRSGFKVAARGSASGPELSEAVNLALRGIVRR